MQRVYHRIYSAVCGEAKCGPEYEVMLSTDFQQIVYLFKTLLIKC